MNNCPNNILHRGDQYILMFSIVDKAQGILERRANDGASALKREE